MIELTTMIFTHPANHHMLWKYLKTHAHDERVWDIFATHYARVLYAAPAYLAILRARLPVEAQEVYDNLVESTPPTETLLPPDFHPIIDGSTEILRDREHLDAVSRFLDFHTQSMAAKPIPVALGVVYSQLLTPGWTDTMDLLLAPYLERMDLIELGIESALDMRYRMWDAILEEITTDHHERR